ncbi:MAG: DUF3794 domain-containing protein [Christensenellales bacterium]
MLEKTMGNFTSNRFVTLDKSQLIINALLAAKDDVKEILSVDVEPQVTSFEPLNGEALVSGRVNVKVLQRRGGRAQQPQLQRRFFGQIQKRAYRAKQLSYI